MAISKMRRRSAFNLPSAWSPGLALPSNVIDEGLERHGIVTLQEPDGTFDNPAVGTGGYNVPEYILRERYGRGAYVTKWAPRGSYFGPGLPDWLNYPVAAVERVKQLAPNKVQYLMETLHGDEASGNREYGDRAAKVLIDAVRRLPPGQRKAAMKAQMDKIDRSLWARTATIARQLQAQGWVPASALAEAMSRAMQAGFHAELIKQGQRVVRGQRAKAMGYLGGLGADAPSSPIPSRSSASPASCPHTWVPANGSVAAHWERTRAGQPGTRDASGGCYIIGTSSGAPGGVVTTGGTVLGKPGSIVAAPQRMVQVGPWQFPADADTYMIGRTVRDHRTGTARQPFDAIPAAWQAAITDAIRKLDPGSRGWAPMTLGLTYVPAAALGINPNLIGPLKTSWVKNSAGQVVDNAYLNQKGWLPIRLFPVQFQAGVNLPAIPIFRTMHPTKNVEYGVFLRSTADGFGVEYPPTINGVQPTTNQPGFGVTGNKPGDTFAGGDGNWFKYGAPRINGPLSFEWKPIPPPADTSFWHDVGRGILDVVTFIPSVLTDVSAAVGNALADAACAALTSTAGQTAAAIAAASQGVPPNVTVAGAQLAANAVGCSGSTDVTPAVIPPPPGKSYLLPLAIGAAAVGAVYLMTRKRT